MASTETKAPAADQSSTLKHLLTERVTKGELELPVLSETSTRLLQLCNDAESSPRDLARYIRQDLAIAGHLLRIANSSLYCGGMPIVSLQQAIARLGVAKLKEIVIVISCGIRVFCAKGFETEVRESFRCSLGVAAFAQEIARQCRMNVEEAFLCGLLHDVGRPVLLQLIADLKAELKRNDIPVCSITVDPSAATPSSNRLACSSS